MEKNYRVCGTIIRFHSKTLLPYRQVKDQAKFFSPKNVTFGRKGLFFFAESIGRYGKFFSCVQGWRYKSFRESDSLRPDETSRQPDGLARRCRAAEASGQLTLLRATHLRSSGWVLFS